MTNPTSALRLAVRPGAATEFRMASPKRLLLRSLGILTLCAASGCLDPASDTTGAVRPDDSGSDSAEERRLRRDSDRDGYAKSPWGADCDDTRASVNPGATETCGTAYDDDCDGSANDLDATGCTPFYADVDGDGRARRGSARRRARRRRGWPRSPRWRGTRPRRAGVARRASARRSRRGRSGVYSELQVAATSSRPPRT